MYGNVNNCARVRSFEECQRHFANTPLPRATRRGRQVWEPNERPLDDKTKHHYRIVRGPNEDYYDAVLYSTTMARYYRPEEGGRRVVYHDDSRQLSRQFMWSVVQSGGRIPKLHTTGGKDVFVPIGPASRYGDFGADLWFTGSGSNFLDVSRSKHAPIGVPRMSDELKAWKKEVRKELAPVFELMKYSVEGTPLVRARRAFVMYDVTHFYLGRVGWAPRQPLTEAATRILVDMYEERTQYIDGDTPARIRAVEASILGELAKMYRGNHFRYEPLPQFPEVLPRNFRFA